MAVKVLGHFTPGETVRDVGSRTVRLVGYGNESRPALACTMA